MKNLLTILCLLACLVACESTDVASAFQKGQEVTITASIGQQRPQALPGMQRVSGKDTDPTNPNGGAIALTWNEGDKILVKVGDNVSEFTLLAGAGTANGSFIGNMPDNGSRFSVQYPTFTPNLAVQQYVENGFDKDLMLMTTKEEGTIDDGFALSADYALLGLHFTGDTIVSKIVLTNLETNATYTLDCSQQVVSISGGKLFYLIVPPGIWNNGMKVDVYDTNHTIILTKAKSEKIVFNASNAMLMQDLEINKAITFEVNGTKYKMMYVEGGSFMMGSAADDEIVNQNLAAMGDELPQHKVTLDSYYIGEIEVTQKLWKDIMGTDVYDLYQNLTHQGSPEPKVVGDNYPIYYMYTSDMVEFTRKLSKVTGLNFRLPTEAEWEYAARGGNKSKGYLYAGSNNVDDVAWYNGNTNNKGVQLVAQKLPNELGIYDMSGNVLERCLDFLEYHEQYAPEDVTNPRGRYIRQAGNRAYRGGSSNMRNDSVRITHRAPQTPTYTSINVGARLVINDNHHFQTFCVNNVWFDMIFVKGNSSLSDFYIGQTEVTQRLWKAVMGTNPCKIQGNDLPVMYVSWQDCQDFIQKLNQLTGYHFRLPTEAEWEYAARGGEKSKGFAYAGSNDLNEVAWYIDNSQDQSQFFATKQPNELGIYDMSGNVWEWCEDYYDTDETMHVVKSGSFHDSASTCRIDARTARSADYKSYIGLRLLLEM